MSDIKRIRRTDEKGMVSMIVTLVMMIIISLIVLGFSESARRNQRQALDTQLGLQAYYAAESGVNDVSNYINAAPGNANLLTKIAGCSGTIGTETYPKALSSDGSVENTCLMVDPNPPSLVADSITTTTGSVVWHVKNANTGHTFRQFQFSWQPPKDEGTCTPSDYKTYPNYGDWDCNRALLRVDIIKTTDANTNAGNAANLAKNTATLYLKPGTLANDVTIDSFGGTITAYQGSCKLGATPAGCTAKVILNKPSSQSEDYYMRITSMYVDAKTVVLSASDDLGGTSFSEGQVVIDSTGRAQDELKRIRVRIPLTASQDTLPVYGLQGSGGICKDLMLNTSLYDTGDCAGIWPN